MENKDFSEWNVQNREISRFSKFKNNVDFESVKLNYNEEAVHIRKENHSNILFSKRRKRLGYNEVDALQQIVCLFIILRK